MRYRTGEEVELWDRVEMWEGCTGIVVFSIDADQYSPGFRKEHWSYLQRGAMVATNQIGLVFASKEDDEIALLHRGGPPGEEERAPIRACGGLPSAAELIGETE